MKFRVTKSSSYDWERSTEIPTIEELIQWCKKTGKTVIINANVEPPELEIYDDWRE